jgi:hypothetical protein
MVVDRVISKLHNAFVKGRRMKMVVDRVIPKLHNAFVKGRQILDCE